MNTRNVFVIVAAFCGLFSNVQSGFAQGSLTPSGPPGPTMVTLSQIEPRTPISSAPFIITNSGSYYLTTNLTVAGGDAIDIDTNGVTLDLNGFTITSTASSANGTAISVSGGDITIVNGHIMSGVTQLYDNFSGPGFGYGISGGSNIRVSGVSVSGCLYNGISLGNGSSSVVESCTVNTVGGYGIIADSVSHCTALLCYDDAITATTVSDSYGFCIGTGDGIEATTANNCQGQVAEFYGFGTGLNANTAINCYGYNNTSGGGLAAYNAINCYGFVSQGGGGLGALGSAMNCYGGNAIALGDSILATIANSCTVGGGMEQITYKYNMP